MDMCYMYRRASMGLYPYWQNIYEASLTDIHNCSELKEKMTCDGQSGLTMDNDR